LFLVLFQTTLKIFINYVIYIINYYKLSKILNDKVSKWCESEEKLSFSIFSRLKVISCVSPKFITICRTFERVQGTKFVDVKYLDSPPLMI
jgi:hypothetical protein